MLSHDKVWSAIDTLARRNGLTPSGLARRAGLDPTTFNPSKRVAGDGRPRWPSTESLAKVLEATGADLTELAVLVNQGEMAAFGRTASLARTVPLLGLAQAGAGGYFDDGGFPAGTGWDEISFPVAHGENVYALEVSGDSMQPLYRDGDILIVSPGAAIRRGDRVVVRTLEGEVMAKVLHRQTAKNIELHSLNPAHPVRLFEMKEIEWVARIVWASQ
ncbi:helix-turn-helix transcriptional regulator [Stappia sp. F7233]|uniref:Helix-turn-helix transcriptional regulator n=1 Tax=Stappia albiluteola TaxID=2758565 RepID=A0A839AH59_9HYPH|nr:helix-turn-helix transcriptional regulator [Stappia albiluteola]MBA5779190.1 helix-turn-helix transcriptional regulator [Stappia albiluteola]